MKSANAKQIAPKFVTDLDAIDAGAKEISLQDAQKLRATVRALVKPKQHKVRKDVIEDAVSEAGLKLGRDSEPVKLLTNVRNAMYKLRKLTEFLGPIVKELGLGSLVRFLDNPYSQPDFGPIGDDPYVPYYVDTLAAAAA